MAKEETRAPLARNAHSEGRGLMRLGLWSMAAAVAVAVAVLIASSETGLRRLANAVTGVQPLTGQQRDVFRDDGEMQRLSETLRQINTDRLRLIARLEAIERHLDDITGSINRAVPAPAVDNPPAGEFPSGPSAQVGAIIPAPTKQPTQAAQQPTATDDTSADPPTPTKSEFGIDLGSAQTIDGLRVLWSQMKGRHGALLEGMRPIVAIREASRPGAMELRLVAGPTPTAALAAKLCTAINAAGALCQPAVFDGQRLALR